MVCIWLDGPGTDYHAGTQPASVPCRTKLTGCSDGSAVDSITPEGRKPVAHDVSRGLLAFAPPGLHRSQSMLHPVDMRSRRRGIPALGGRRLFQDMHPKPRTWYPSGQVAGSRARRSSSVSINSLQVVAHLWQM